MGGAFANCTSVTTIPANLFKGCSKVTSFAQTFSQCQSLVEIPAGLFDDCTSATSFSQTFYNCKSLLTTPEGLFDNFKLVTNFSSCFQSCSNLNQEYNMTSAGLPKLWQRIGDDNGVAVTGYSSFARSAHATFRASVPTNWGGTNIYCQRK